MTLTASPRVLKAGIAVVEPEGGAVQRVIPLQYNPDTLTRSLKVQAMGEDADRSERLRLTGPPVETYSLGAVLDATDALERGEASAVENGVAAHLAALEMLVSPASGEIQENDARLDAGELRILAMIQPLALFVWSRHRIVPVRITELGVTEEAFDVHLNPIRVRLDLTLRVLTTDDLGLAGRGGAIFMNHLRGKERLAGRFEGAGLASLGIGEIP
jgi:hypothetical protein